MSEYTHYAHPKCVHTYIIRIKFDTVASILTRIFKEMNEDDSFLQCNTEKDKTRIHHRTAGMYM